MTSENTGKSKLFAVFKKDNSIITERANISLFLLLSISLTHFAVPPVAKSSSTITNFLNGKIADSWMDRLSLPYPSS